MKKRWFIVVIVILLVSSLITGCGVSKSQYDAATADLQTAQADLKATQTQLQESQSELTKTKAELQTAQTGLNATERTLQTQLQQAQSELTKTKADLESAQAQVQSLQEDQDAVTKKRAEASNYTEFLVISMYEMFMATGINPGVTFLNEREWKQTMNSKAAIIRDATLTDYVRQLDAGGKDAYFRLWCYCVDKINQTLR